jgi:AraC family transcriptional regulator
LPLNRFASDMAGTRRDDRPARAVRLATASASGFAATLIHSEPGIHDSRAWPEHRLLVQTSLTPHRARCVFDGQVAERIDQRGDFCLQPATLPGLWENGGAVELVELRIAPHLMAETAEGLEMASGGADMAARLWARDAHIEHIALGLKSELEGGAPPLRMYVESLGVALAIRLLSQFGPRARRARHGLSRRQLQRVFEHVDAHLSQDLPLADLAAAAGLSVPHFTMLFRRSTGLSAHRYVVQQRVLRARTLILQGKLGITQVALETGFSHGSHLARCMRKVAGLSPGEVARCR